VLIWNTRARPWVLAAGVMLHLGIDLNIEIGIFSYAMLVMYVAWINPTTAQHLPTTLKNATTQLRTRLTRNHNTPPTPEPTPTPDQLTHA
jgi:hypothetical protein